MCYIVQRGLIKVGISAAENIDAGGEVKAYKKDGGRERER